MLICHFLNFLLIGKIKVIFISPQNYIWQDGIRISFSKYCINVEHYVMLCICTMICDMFWGSILLDKINNRLQTSLLLLSTKRSWYLYFFLNGQGGILDYNLLPSTPLTSGDLRRIKVKIQMSFIYKVKCEPTYVLHLS